MMQKVKQHIGAVIIWTIIISVSVPSAWIALLFIRPYNAITLEGGSTSFEQEVESGGIINFRGARYCNSGYPVEVTRFIENDTGAIQLLSLTFNDQGEAFCVEGTPFRVQIPADVPPGTWRLKTVTAYKPNITFRKIEVVSTSNWFTVVDEVQVYAEHGAGFGGQVERHLGITKAS